MKGKRVRIPKIVKRKGLKGYYLRITRPNGSRPYILLGNTKTEARINYEDYIAQLRSTKNNYPTYRITIDQGIEYYFRYKETRLYPTSLKRYKGSIRNFRRFLKEGGSSLRYVDEITSNHIVDFMDSRIKQGANHSTINQEKQKVYNLFDVLIKQNKLTGENPAAKVEWLKEKMSDLQPLTHEQIHRLFDVAKTHGKRIDWYPILVTFYYTGMRRNELRFLTWEDVSFKLNRILIRPKQVSDKEYFTPKTWQTREIPIHNELRPILKALPKTSRWVFPSSKDKPLAINKPYDEFQVMLDKASIPRIKLHILRHTWASHASMAGVPLDVIQKIGGWKDREVMERYKRYQPDWIASQFCTKSFLFTRQEKGEDI